MKFLLFLAVQWVNKPLYQLGIAGKKYVGLFFSGDGWNGVFGQYYHCLGTTSGFMPRSHSWVYLRLATCKAFLLNILLFFGTHSRDQALGLYSGIKPGWACGTIWSTVNQT